MMIKSNDDRFRASPPHATIAPESKDPLVRELYDRLFATLNEFGPVTAYALKTRIIFRLTQPADLDADLVALLHEGYMLGCQPLTGR